VGVSWDHQISQGEAELKRTVVIVLSVIGVVALFQARLNAEVGLKAGFSLAKYQWVIPDPDNLDWTFLPFAAGGLYFEAGKGLLSVETGVFFARMGGRYEIEGDSLEFRYDYIQLPLVLKMNILPSSFVCPFFGFGGYGAYLVKAQGVLVIGGEREVEDLIEEYQRIDAGLLFSGGFGFRWARTTLTLECRYAYGLVNALKYPAEV
jgi:hypothetical protein